ncbi:uridylate-specific endoribonuclease B-like [Haliotis rufescens]|uniref:uridylate-specific endoribonuclease B-like n=1 Tax=Haliotis rufescens TaxID=6454 RepID=UPI00201E9463|nr:uridylate-specific endoribonuclease B-like [Haliotis rufescens]
MELCLLFVVLVAGAQAQFLLRHGTCANRCFTNNDYAQSCQCDYDCEDIGNCCGDFWTRCRGSEYGLVVTTQEMNTFVQGIWDNDVNRIDSSLFTLNYQGKIISPDISDGAPDRFIQPVGTGLDDLFDTTNTTYHAFIRLLNNYEINVQHDEHRPEHEIKEEDTFWNTIVQTKVMQMTFQFLLNNGFIKSDMHAFRTVINEMWFELYPKSHATVKSDSGFEHIMIGEKTQHHQHAQQNQSATIGGFGNWVQFYQEEKAGNLDYYGYIKYTQDPNVVDVLFNWKNALAKGKTFFVGTSPEFDLALYTVCGLAYPNKDCPIVINGHRYRVDATTGRHQEVLQLTSATLKFQDPSATTTTAPALDY